MGGGGGAFIAAAAAAVSPRLQNITTDAKSLDPEFMAGAYGEQKLRREDFT